MGVFNSLEKSKILDCEFSLEELKLIKEGVLSLPSPVNERILCSILVKCDRGIKYDKSK